MNESLPPVEPKKNNTKTILTVVVAVLVGVLRLHHGAAGGPVPARELGLQPGQSAQDSDLVLNRCSGGIIYPIHPSK
jgi:hypothetical protein